MTLSRARTFLTDLFTTAIAAADPMRVIAEHLPPKPKGRLIVIGAGKASARMAEAVEAQYGPCDGLVVTRYGYARTCQGIEIIEAAHPVPDGASETASKRMLHLVEGLTTDDLVICLISGGGSALLCAPANGLSLSDKIAMNDALLTSGAPISDINAIRKMVSDVKGGKLAAACYPATVLSLLISDVPGDDPAVIASGPTVGSSVDRNAVLAIFDRWLPQAPQSWREALTQGHVVSPDDPRLARATTKVIAAPSGSLLAAATKAQTQAIEVEIMGDALEGEARDLGKKHAKIALERQASMTPESPPLLLLSGGECTVTRRGNGVGGPNAEYALAAALTLDGAADIYLLAGDTDGVDGAAEIAGAFVDPLTLKRGAESEKALADNDAHTYFSALGQSVVTGPTLTNVNDFRAILIGPPMPK